MSTPASRGVNHGVQDLDKLITELLKGIQPALRTNAKEAIASFSASFFANPLPATYTQATNMIFGVDQGIGLCRAVGLANKFSNKLRKASSHALILLVKLLNPQTNPASHQIFLSVVQMASQPIIDSMRLGDHILYGDLTTKESAETFLMYLKQAPSKALNHPAQMKTVALKDAHKVVVNSPTTCVGTNPSSTYPTAIPRPPSSQSISEDLPSSVPSSKNASLADPARHSNHVIRSARDQQYHSNLNTLNDDTQEHSDDDSVTSFGPIPSDDEDLVPDELVQGGKQNDDQSNVSNQTKQRSSSSWHNNASTSLLTEDQTTISDTRNTESISDNQMRKSGHSTEDKPKQVPQTPPHSQTDQIRGTEGCIYVINPQEDSTDFFSPLRGNASTSPKNANPTSSKSDFNSKSLYVSIPDSNPASPAPAEKAGGVSPLPVTPSGASIKGKIRNLFSKFRGETPSNTTSASNPASSQQTTTTSSFIFGRPLHELINAGLCDANFVPFFVRTIMDYVVKNEDIVKTDSIFRLNGEPATVQRLKQLIDTLQPIDPSQWDVHSLVTVIKIWLRDMPIPLVPYFLYQPLLDAYKTENEDELFRLLDTMPEEERYVYQYIVTMCVRVAAYRTSNFMTTQNLAIVFAPNLFRSQTPVYSQMAVEMPLAIGVLQLSMKAVECSFVESHRSRQGTIVLSNNRSFQSFGTTAQRGVTTETPTVVTMSDEEMKSFAYRQHGHRASIADMKRENVDTYRRLEGRMNHAIVDDADRRGGTHLNNAPIIEEGDGDGEDENGEIDAQTIISTETVAEEDDENSDVVSTSTSNVSPHGLQPEIDGRELSSTPVIPIVQKVKTPSTFTQTQSSTSLGHSNTIASSPPQPQQNLMGHNVVPASTQPIPVKSSTLNPQTVLTRGPALSNADSHHVQNLPNGSPPFSGPASPPQGMQYVYAFSASPSNASTLRSQPGSQRTMRSLRRNNQSQTLNLSSPVGSYGSTQATQNNTFGQNAFSAPSASGFVTPGSSGRNPPHLNTLRRGPTPAGSPPPRSNLTLKTMGSHSVPTMTSSGSPKAANTTSNIKCDNMSSSLDAVDTQDDPFAPPPPPPMRDGMVIETEEFDIETMMRRASCAIPPDPQMLADGWIEFLDPNNTTYYYHPLTNTASWIRPCFANRKKVQLNPAVSTKLRTAKT